MIKSILNLTSCAILIAATPAFASIIKKPPAKPVELSYSELTCTETDQAGIAEIVSTMAENGKVTLLFKQTALREVGAQIDHVHPLKFLSTVFSNPRLKMNMVAIWDDYFKRNGFLNGHGNLEGLSQSLSREASRGRLNIYLNEFSAEIGVPIENLRPYFDSQNWESLVLYLIQYGN